MGFADLGEDLCAGALGTFLLHFVVEGAFQACCDAVAAGGRGGSFADGETFDFAAVTLLGVDAC